MFGLLQCGLAALNMIRPATPAPPSENRAAREAAPAKTRLQSMRVVTPSHELERLSEELALRVPHIPIATAPTGESGAHVWIRVRRLPTGGPVYAVTVVVSDGRGYFRRLEADGDEPVRLIAANVANLLIAIEDGTAPPDREDAVIPPEPQESTISTEANENEPSMEASSLPGSRTGKGGEGVSVALTLSAESVFGLGPPTDAPVFAAAGGTVGALARGPRGAALALDLRFLGRGAGTDAGVLRTRIALGGGYILVRRRFELDALGIGAIEPWTITGDLAVRPRPRMLLGLGIRLAAGYRFPIRTGVVRVAPRVEMIVSGVSADGLRAAQVTRADDGSPLARAGGLEFGAGIDVAVWFPVGRAM